MDAVINDRFIIVSGQYMGPSIHSVQALPTATQGFVDLGLK